MNTDPALATLIGDLGKSMGLESLAPDANGVCALEFDERYVVGLRAGDDEDELWLFADLGQPAAGSDIYPHLLRANLFWRGSGSATLSLSHDEAPRVVIAGRLAWRGHSGGSLGKEIQSFVDVVENWTTLIALPLAEWPDTAATAASDPVDQASLGQLLAYRA